MGILHLTGLAWEPFGSYLTAVGVLFLLNQQVDPSATGHWTTGGFVLSSTLDREGLLNHFCRDYRPTAVASPWNRNSGFYPSRQPSGVDRLQASQEARFAEYREAIGFMRAVLARQGLRKAPTGRQKTLLLRTLATEAPPSAKRWIEAVAHIAPSAINFRELLFTGGNDARYEISAGFLNALASLFFNPRRSAEDTRLLLAATLFDEPYLGRPFREPGGPYSPRTASGYNASSSGPSLPASNPWETVLALEGVIALAHSATLAEDGPTLRLPLWQSPPADSAHLSVASQQRNGKAHFLIPSYRGPQSQQWAQPARWVPELPPVDTNCPLSITRALECIGRARLHRDQQVSLPPMWLQADDETPEFRLALALSGLGRGQHPKLHLRPQMAAFAGKDLCDRLLSLSRYRIEQATRVSKMPNRAGIVRFNGPFWSDTPANPRDIAAFLLGAVDEERLQDLFHALILLSSVPQRQAPPGNHHPLPYPYRLAKLAFHHQLHDRRPPPPDLCDCLARGDSLAAMRSAHRYLSPRHAALELPVNPPAIAPEQGRRMAAALLFPISSQTYDTFSHSLKEFQL
jgi:hypothetical protein